MCAAITSEEIAADAAATVSSTVPETSACTWLFDAGRGVNARVEQAAGGGIESARRAFPDGQEVADIGTGGWWVDSLSLLYVAEDQVLFAVQLVGFPPEATRQEIATRIAQRMVDRL